MNVLTLAGLAVYGLWEGRRSQQAVDGALALSRSRATVAVTLLQEMLQSEVDAAFAQAGVTGNAQGDVALRGPGLIRLLLAMRGIPIFDEKAFRGLVRKAVIVRLGSNVLEDRHFNVRREMIFDSGTKDRREVHEAILASIRGGSIVRRGDFVAGPLYYKDRPFGGFYFQLLGGESAGAAAADPLRPLRYIVVIAAPGIVFLLLFLLLFMNRNVLQPVLALGRVARAVAAGDYSRRVDQRATGDEIASVQEAFNTMLELLEEYRFRMQSRIDEKTREIERKTQELMLAQRLAATGTLASGIAHEINNPLGGMVNALERIQRADIPDEKKDAYYRILKEGIERIGNTVRQVLSVSPRKMTPGPVDLVEIAQRTLGLVSHRARRKGVDVQVEVEEVPPVLGEANEIGQVFLNLLINAVDASADGGTIRLRIRREGSSAVIEVADEGEGMNPEVAARAFDFFFTTKTVGEGTGLGLAIVHHIVEAHGGRITLDTAPGRGTVFKVVLPLQDVSE